MTKLFLVAVSWLTLIFPCSGQKVFDILGQAQNIINGAINDADNSANYAINHSANELNVLVSSANSMLAGDMDKTVDQLQGVSRALMDEIQNLTNTITTGKSQIEHMADNLTLDLDALIGNTLLYKGSAPFLLQRVSNLNQLFQPTGNYKIQLTGSNFGFNSNKVRVIFNRILLNDKDVTGLVDLNGNTDVNTKGIYFKNSLLNPYFDSINLKPVKIGLEIIKEEYKGFLHKSWKQTAAISNSFYIFLFPDYTGKFTFDLTFEKLDWIDAGTVSIQRTGPDANCSSGCSNWYGSPYDFQLDVPFRNTPPKEGDFMLANPKIQCLSGNLCAFDVDVSATLTNNESSVVAHIRARTHPTTYILSATKLTFAPVGTANQLITMSFQYDKIFSIPFDNTIRSVVVSGSDISTGQKFSYDITQVNPIFQLISDDVINNQKIYKIQMKRPFGQ